MSQKKKLMNKYVQGKKNLWAVGSDLLPRQNSWHLLTKPDT